LSLSMTKETSRIQQKWLSSSAQLLA
jgi:hypothetical protein